MAEFFETIRDTTVNAVKRADESYRAAKLKVSVIALQKVLAEQYRELGAVVYKICKSEDVAKKEASEQIALMTLRIEGTRKRIAVLERRIEDLLGLVHCPDCGNTVKMKNAYCSSCGRRLAAEEEDVFENENQMHLPKEKEENV